MRSWRFSRKKWDKKMGTDLFSYAQSQGILLRPGKIDLSPFFVPIFS